MADGAQAASIALQVLEHTEEIDVAAAAPTLEHADLLAGLRTIAAMHRWDSREVRAVAFLMFENGHLTHDETAWMSGYIGTDPPMRPTSPMG